MRIAFVHLPRFPIQRKVQEVPALAKQAFALVQESGGSRRIAWASGAALRMGILPGASLTAATALAPELRHFPYDAEAEVKALASLGEALMLLTPAFQLSEPDGLWLDASAAPLLRGERAWGERVVSLCAELGWMTRVCIASQASTARMLARHGRGEAGERSAVNERSAAGARGGASKPGAGFAGVRTSHVQRIEEGREAAALAPLPLSALEDAPLARAALASLGLGTLGEVASLPPGAWVARAGAEGKRVHALVQGTAPSRFVPHALPEVLEEAVTLEWPAESLEPLLFSLKTVIDRVAARLSGRKRAGVRLRFTLQLDPSGKAELVLSLARPTSQAKLLLDLARHRLSEVRLENPVARLIVLVEEACDDPGQQLSLGDGPQGDAGLEVVLSRLATTLGEAALFSAALAPMHRPEAGFTRARFRPPEAAKGLLSDLLAEASGVPGEAGEEVLVERPSRLFASPSPVEAELGREGELVSARVLGRRRRVMALSGPERLGGEWWAPTAFSRDYYRVVLEGMGPAWIFRDGRDGQFYLHGLFD